MNNKNFVHYSDLTPSQAKIVNLPPTKNYVITGAPGTGKTVVALYMAEKFSQSGKKVLFLVHNRPLMLYLQSMYGNDSPFEINTFNAWFNKFYYNLCGKRVPNFEYDWEDIKGDLGTCAIQYDYIIFDEAQDFPIQLIDSVKQIAPYVACFFDANQRLNEDSLDEDELLDLLGEMRPYPLLENFRNTKEIFDFAKAFSSNEQAEANNSNGKKPYLIHVSDYKEQNNAILNIIKSNPDAKTIGIFANGKSIPVTFDTISKNTELPVNAYLTKSKEFRSPDFTKNGVFILPYNCAKGLEFDVVIFTMCDKIYMPMGAEDPNTLLYVASTRAKQKLYCIYSSMVCKTDKYINFFAPVKDTINELSEGILDWNLKASK